MENMFDNFNELIMYRGKSLPKFLHYLINVGLNGSSHEEKPFIKIWHLENSKFCVYAVMGLYSQYLQRKVNLLNTYIKGIIT